MFNSCNQRCSTSVGSKQNKNGSMRNLFAIDFLKSITTAATEKYCIADLLQASTITLLLICWSGINTTRNHSSNTINIDSQMYPHQEQKPPLGGEQQNQWQLLLHGSYEPHVRQHVGSMHRSQTSQNQNLYVLFY